MKFSLARGALAVAAALTLASCGGGKATFPINVHVTNVLYPGLVLTTNGQDLAIAPPADPTQAVNTVFPKEIEYGESYNVQPKDLAVDTSGNIVAGAFPKHQTCKAADIYPDNLPVYGNAGQLAKIQINYVCSINTYALGGKVVGLKNTGLALANGSSAPAIGITPASETATPTVYTGADVTFAMAPVAYNATYGVRVLSQPTGQTCTVSGGGNGNGTGTMDDAAEAANGVSNLLVTCVNN